MKRKMSPCVVLAVLAVLPAIASAQSTYIINDFEPGGQNDLVFGANGGLANLAPATFNGSTRLRAETVEIGSFSQYLSAFTGDRGSVLFTALAAGSQLSVDVSNLGSEVFTGPTSLPEENYFFIRLVVNTNAWVVNPGNNYRTFNNYFIGQFDNTGTLSVDLTANPDIGLAAANYAAGGGTFFGLTFDNSGFPGSGAAGNVFYLDDLRVSGITSTRNYQRTGSGDWNAVGSFNINAPNAADAVAVLGSSITAPSTVFTNTAVTAGTLRFDNTNTYVLSGAGSLTLSVTTGAALVDVVQGNHKIALPVTFSSDSTVAVSGSSTLLISDEVSLATGTTLTKTGAGTVTFAGRVTTPGAASINLKGGLVNFDISSTDGTVNLNIDPATVNVGADQTFNALALDAGGNTLVVGRTSTGQTVSADVLSTSLSVTNGVSNVINTTRVNNSVDTGTLLIDSTSSVQKIGPGSLSATLSTIDGTYTHTAGSASLGQVSGAGSIAANGGSLTATRIRVGSLSVATGVTVSTTQAGGTNELSAISLSAGSTLNIGTGSLALHNASGAALISSTAALRAAVQSWYAGGSRNGTGLAATVGAFTTIAVLPNLDLAGNRFFDSFGGVTLGANDLVARYTYIGDTDLNGVVNGTDLANLIEGLSTGATGWRNGDLDYNGVVNGADYTLLLGGLANQGAPLGEIGVVAGGTVPEPTALLPLGVGSLAMIRRRRR